MIYYNKKSKQKIVHISNCRYINKGNENIGTFCTLQEAYKKGYRLCKKCNPVTVAFKKEKNAILDFVLKNKYFCKVKQDYISIISAESQWKIVADLYGKGVTLYHKNKEKAKECDDEYIKNYHFQHIKCNSILSYLVYISMHDDFREKKPFCPLEKARPYTPKWKNYQKRAKERQRQKAIAKVKRLINSQITKKALSL